MRFRNSMRLLLENFKSVYKLLLYKVTISLVAIALCCTFVLPELSGIIESTPMQALLLDCEKFIKAVLALDGAALMAAKEAILGVEGSLRALLQALSLQTPSLILTCLGCVFVFFVKRFVEIDF